MNMKPTPVLLLAALLVLLCGCAGAISRDALLTQMQQQPGPLIIDVRSRGEFERDHLPGAVHIPFYSIGSELGKREDGKRRSIVVYCEHGPRAALAGILVFMSGYENFYSLEGHMRGWRAAGLPVEKAAP